MTGVQMIKGCLKTVLLASLLVSTTALHASQTYLFSQNDFAGGGSISGSFSGSDLNQDGFLQGSTFEADGLAELTSFTVTWSGNATIPEFVHTLTDLTYFSFDLSKATLGEVSPEGIATKWLGSSGYQYLSGQGVNAFDGSYVRDANSEEYVETFALTQVSAVPLPGAIWLFAPVLFGLTRVGHRKAENPSC